MIKQERKCGLKHDRHTKARCNERNERLMKIINADTIIDDGRLFNIKVIVHICYHDVITSDINEDVDEMIATLNRDYNNKASNFNNYGKGYTGKNGDMQKYKEVYLFEFPWEKKAFDKNDINCKNSTYWFDPIEFDRKIHYYSLYVNPIINEIKYKIKTNKLKLIA